MTQTNLTFGALALLSLGFAACSGDESTGTPGAPDGSAGTGGSATGGASNGTGGKGTGGKGTGGGATGGAGGSGGGTGGASAGGSGAGGVKSDSGTPDGADSSVKPDGAAGGSDGAAEAAAPACPDSGKYSFTFSGGGCGDLNSGAPSQRFDGSNCSGSLEYDSGGSKGVSGSATFGTDGGALTATNLSIGSATMHCTGHATASTITFECSGDASTCTIHMTRTGPL